MKNIFPSLIGNDKIKSILSDDILNRTMFHAYVIEGPVGSGKHTLVSSIIRSLCCLNTSGGIPCGECSNCKKINGNMYADIYYLNRGDKATISVEKTRNMLETVLYSPNEECDYKFYIIEEAELMTPAAQNALLLTLEEPPEYVIFFLLCTDVNMLLETVRSRTISLRTEIFPADRIFEYLKGNKAFTRYTDDKLMTAASVSGGSLGTAMSILKGKDKSSGFAEKAGEFTNLLCCGKKSEALLFTSSLKFERNQYDLFFRFVGAALRDLISYKNGGTYLLYYTDIEQVASMCSRITLARLVSLYDKVESARNDIIVSNSNITLTLSHLASCAAE